MSSETPLQQMTCGLKVNTQSPNWYKKLQKALTSIKGINYIIDAEKGNALVSGRVNPYKIMKKLNKFKEHAEIAWIRTGKGQNDGFSDHGYFNSDPYFQHQYPYGQSSGYWAAGGGGGSYDGYYGGGGYGQMVAPSYGGYYGQYGGGYGYSRY